ncbi:MAG: EF-P lysine aminoacylase EpmA [Gammaproteobacteria bacterium]
MDDWRPTAGRHALEVRAELMRRTRAFFDARGLLEVETPMLSAAAPTDPNIPSVAAGDRWLQTSPEFPMKRLLAAGVGDCWQLCRVFRAGEAGRLHNPEFTLLEWYRVGWDDAALMDEVETLVNEVLAGFRALEPGERVTYAQAFHRATGVAHVAADAERCAAIARDCNLAAPPDLTLAQWHDLILGAVAMPKLGCDGLCFITDFPAEQAALARLRGMPPVAARFELVVDGMEIANGYHELCDPVEQARRFHADNAARATAGLPTLPQDARLLAALEHGLPDCAGVALGFDRLVMLALGADHIQDAIAFPADRA